MKSFLLVFALVPFIQGEKVQEDLIDLQQHVLMPQIQELFVRYLITDAEFRETIQFFRGAEFAEMWSKFLEIPKVRELFTYMSSAGLHVNEALELLARFTGMEKLQMRFKRSNSPKSGGFRAFIGEVIELCAASDLVSVHEEKMASNPEYRELVKKMEAPEFKQLVADARADPKVKRLQDELSPYGVDFNMLFDFWKSLFGWTSLF